MAFDTIQFDPIVVAALDALSPEERGRVRGELHRLIDFSTSDPASLQVRRVNPGGRPGLSPGASLYLLDLEDRLRAVFHPDEKSRTIRVVDLFRSGAFWDVPANAVGARGV